jgi:hypothetical protein
LEVDISFSMQMADQGSVESVVNALVLHAAWKETHGADQTSGRGAESVFTSNLEMSSFRTSAHVDCGHSLHRSSSGMRQLIHVIGIGAQTFRKNAQSLLAVVGLGWTSSLNIIPYMLNRV